MENFKGLKNRMEGGPAPFMKLSRVIQPEPGGLKEMSSILADQQRPRIWAQTLGGGGCCGVSANEYSCTQEPK